jgi:hypothetical protein
MARTVSPCPLVPLYSPESEVELAFLKSILDDSDILYFVKNEAFGSLAVGPQIEHYNRRLISVPEDRFDEALDLLREFLDKTRSAPAPRRRYSFGEKLRLTLEFFLFGWVMPGRRPSLGPRFRLIRNPSPGPRRPRPSPRLKLLRSPAADGRPSSGAG